MIYDLTLRIAYDYAHPVAGARHVLRVRPLADAQQQLCSAPRVVTAPAPNEHKQELDFFGNATDHLLYSQAHGSLSVTMQSRVCVKRLPSHLALTPGIRELANEAASFRDPGGRSPMHFLADSRVVRSSPAVRSFAAETIAFNQPAGMAVLELARRIRSDFAYLPGSTTVGTGIDEALRHRQGVCQDFAHVMIAALRSIAVPAAYVSGFLRTDPPPGQPRLEGVDAMHAWVRVWLGEEAGWVGFDPTNGIEEGDDHIVVAQGRDYADAAPIQGVLVTSGSQLAAHSVDVVPLSNELDIS